MMAKLSDMAKLYGNKAPYCWTVYSALKKRKSKKDGKTRLKNRIQIIIID